MAHLTGAVKAARSLAELRALLDKAAPRFNAINDCAFCGRVAALAHDDADLARRLFAARATSWLQRPDGSGKEGRSVANLLHSAAKVRPPAALATALAHAAVRLAPSFNAREAANSLWAVAKLGVSAGVVGPLAHAAVRLAPSFNAQEAANSLWAVTTLGVSDAGVVGPLAHAAVRLAPSFNAQNAANSLWAVAKLGVSDPAVVGPLAHAAVRLAPSFDAQGATNSLWAVAKLGVSDAGVVGPLAHAAVRLAPSFNEQNAANSLWAVATLGVSDAGVVEPLAHAAVRVAPSFNAQNAANSLWAVATLDVSDAGVVGPLAHAAVRLAPSFNALHVHQVLQAHYAVPGGLLDATIVRELRARFVTGPTTSSVSQRCVAAALKRLGHSVSEEAPLLDGLLTIDVRLDQPGAVGGCSVAVEFDGPFHFLRTLAPTPAGAASLTVDGATLLRNRLIASAGLALVCVPYTEWVDVKRAGAAAEDAYLTRRLAEASAPPALCASSSAAARPASAVQQSLCSAPVLGHPRYVSMHTLAAAASAPRDIGGAAAAAPAAWSGDGDDGGGGHTGDERTLALGAVLDATCGRCGGGGGDLAHECSSSQLRVKPPSASNAPPALAFMAPPALAGVRLQAPPAARGRAHAGMGRGTAAATMPAWMTMATAAVAGGARAVGRAPAGAAVSARGPAARWAVRPLRGVGTTVPGTWQTLDGAVTMWMGDDAPSPSRPLDSASSPSSSASASRQRHRSTDDTSPRDLPHHHGDGAGIRGGGDDRGRDGRRDAPLPPRGATDDSDDDATSVGDGGGAGRGARSSYAWRGWRERERDREWSGGGVGGSRSRSRSRSPRRDHSRHTWRDGGRRSGEHAGSGGDNDGQ